MRGRKELARDNSSEGDILKRHNRSVPHGFLKLMGKDKLSEVAPGYGVETVATLLFSDIRDFTTLSESMAPHRAFEFINEYFARMEPCVGEFREIVDKYMGNGIIALVPDALGVEKNFLPFQIHLFVVDWVITHTQKLDGHFGRFLRFRKGTHTCASCGEY